MEKYFHFLFYPAFLFVVSCAFSPEDEILPSSVPLADPGVLCHEGVYYAYGTNPDNKIGIYKSRNLKDWQCVRQELDTQDMWGKTLFWAPEVYYIKEKNKFLMYYTSDDRICAAWSDLPEGPFRQEVKEPMIDFRTVDNTLFTDDDGKSYIYFNGFDDGMTIWGAELESNLVTIKKNTLKKCLSTSQQWEEVWPKVNEGAFVVKHEGTYYMLYSANSYLSQYYGIGYAQADSPLGPWIKYDRNPILQKPANLVGAGHSSLFQTKSGSLKMVFHAHRNDNYVFPRVMYTADVRIASEKQPAIEIKHIKQTKLN